MHVGDGKLTGPSNTLAEKGWVLVVPGRTEKETVGQKAEESWEVEGD